MDIECLIFRKNGIILYIMLHFSIHSVIYGLIHGNGANIYFIYNIATLKTGRDQAKWTNSENGNASDFEENAVEVRIRW